MKIGLISDIHGNIYNLKETYNYLEGKVDQIYFLGDAIGYLDKGKECINFLIEKNIICIQGNHEQMALGIIDLNEKKDIIYNIKSCLKTLTQEDIECIKSWPTDRLEEIDGITILLVHGSPNNKTEGYIYPDTNLDDFNINNIDFVLCGHTHRPFIRKKGNTTYVNPGSVGMPRDNGKLMSFAILDTKVKTCEIKRIKTSPNTIKLINNNKNIHSSVKNLMKRESDSYFGSIINK
ncbi:MAG: metallophosphatase family protein [Crocinitomicaceae bacterium]|nr:metallophosphatase family protein [Crocinitomicaceae bacterium]